MDALAFSLFLVLLLGAVALVWRRPALALYAFVIGLAVHTGLAFLLYAAGVRGWELTAMQAWKEVLLAVLVARVGWTVLRERRLPFAPRAVDLAALAFLAVVAVYAVLPQSLLGGEATARSELYALRHALVPVAAFLAGRSLLLRRGQVRLALVLALATAAAVAAFGLVEEYSVSLERWRAAEAPAFFRSQLGSAEYHGPAGLPENFVLNTSEGLYRRLVSTFLSPLGSAYAFAVVLCIAAAGLYGFLRRELVLAGGALLFAALLFTFTRSAILALACGLAVLAVAARRWIALPLAAAVLAAGVSFAAVLPDVAPQTHFFPEDIAYQEARAREAGPIATGSPLETSVRLADPSSQAHLQALEDGLANLASHPQGHGLGNAGDPAARAGVESRAGESAYLELAADTGLAGLLAWLAFSALVLVGLLRKARSAPERFDRSLAAGLVAAGAALFALAVLSDVWGFPWVTYVFWLLAGSAVRGYEPPVEAGEPSAPAVAAREPAYV